MDSTFYNADDVAAQLQVTPDVLRHWTREFAAQLSVSAAGSSYYRYTADDLRRLRTVRDLLGQGKSMDEVTSHLAPDTHNAAATPDPVQPAPGSAVVIHPGDPDSGTGSMVLREVLTGFAAGQEAILNSQQANRNLMGVVIQDNFSLKEENAKLRERMMKLEQELNELKRQQAEQRAHLELRLRQVEQRRDWLSRLVGF
ncbi:MAG: MerR family transcriptional regulator [Chloroflexi bacterium]|nr:MerR family transcriptional regulator [Chloroflexota bacterium]